MTCAPCGHENRESARFCGTCAAPLGGALVCPSCGTQNLPGQRFCDACGRLLVRTSAPRDPRALTPKHLAERTLAARAALEGERKQVTVFFADVKSSMELAGQLDPEEWHRIMDRFFQLLADGVHRFEGTVVHFTGDGIMALFGAPIAYEDHARRACYAALHLMDMLRAYADELRRTRGLNFAVRVGLNSGEVVVGTFAADLEMEYYTAEGSTVGLASRMEQLAAPDRVNLTEHTAALVHGFFRLRDLGPFAVKGVREPVRVYELEGLGPLRTRLEVARTRGFSRFVGRDAEMAVLETALVRAVAGNAQVIGVVADPGVGKSRLCYEFAERCRARGLPVYEAHAPAHAKAIPFLTLLEYLRGYFGVGEQDAALTVREKIAGKVLLLDGEMTDALPLLFDLLGVPDPERPASRIDPEARQRQLFDAMKRLTHAQSRREPTVSVVEDLHWLDAGSGAFLENCVEALPGTRHLVVLNFRPEYHAAWMQKSYYQQLPLLPLAPEAIDALLRDLLGTDASVEGLRALIRERTGGNPFFIEEVVQSLVESGTLLGARSAYRLLRPVDEVAVPVTVQAVLAARIDRLPERDKQVLETAAVIGKEFTQSVLARVVELPAADLAAVLRALVTAEFLYEEALHPEAVYTFKHPLTHEVAYGSQLAARRKRIHAAVARAVEDLDGRRLDERAAFLAHHCELAEDAARAACWHRRAAEWAGGNHMAEGLRHWRRVRELLDTLPPSPATMGDGATARAHLIQLAHHLGGSRDEVALLMSEARALAERSGDVRVLALVLVSAGFFTALSGAPLDGVPLLEEAMQRADESGDTGLKVSARHYLHLGYTAVGRLTEALSRSDEGIALGERDPEAGTEIIGYSAYRLIRAERGSILSLAGRLRQAAREVDQAIECAQQGGQWVPGSFANGYGYVTFCDFSGKTHAALAHGRASVELAERSGNEAARVLAFAALGLAHVLNGQGREALASLTQALLIARERGALLIFEAQYLSWLARAQLGLGEWAAARTTAEEAIDVARRRGTRLLAIEPHVVLARALIDAATGDGERRGEIDSALTAALRLAEETGARGYVPFIHYEQAELARLVGDDATRERELGEAHRLFTEMGATARAEQVAKELSA